QRRRARSHGEVERQREPRPREGEQPLALGAEVLEHGEERPPAGGADDVEKAADGGGIGVGQHALVLSEAAPAGEARPVLQDVERIEEGGRMEDAAGGAMAPVDERVEGADGEPVEERRRRVEGNRPRALWRRKTTRRRRRLAPAAAVENAAAVARQAVDPG